MEQTKTFQSVAFECGFVEGNETPEESIMWFRRILPDTATNTHLRMCVDSLTKSATIYWMGIGGKVQSKTFRAAPAMEEWLRLAGDMSAEGLLRAAARASL
jgi:hypothetical protein